MRKIGLGFIALVVLTAAGCGGSGNGSVASAFAGTFSGPWSQANDVAGQPPVATGSMTLQIDSHGSITGTYAQTTPTAKSGNLTGTVKSNGDLAFDVAFPGDTTGFAGNVSLAGNELTGTFGEVNVASSGFAPAMDLTRQ